MADTARGDFSNLVCSDCGEKGCEFKHWGPLVPEGESGTFCLFCWYERNDVALRQEPPKPLGTAPPGIPQELLEKEIEVKTLSGSVYMLVPTGTEQEVTVSCSSRDFDFTRARVLCLAEGKKLFFKSLNGNNPGSLWGTSLVVSINAHDYSSR